MKRLIALGLCALVPMLLLAEGQPKEMRAGMYPKAATRQDGDVYFVDGQQELQRLLGMKLNTSRARNVILFVADGNGVATVTATRILDGQLRGESGEENSLVYERFPFMGLVKTYTIDMQVPDSAGTATALHTGIKTDSGVIGAGPGVVRGDHATVAGNELTSILGLAEMAGMSTGVISTARITHATPAAAYAVSAERGWEADTDIPEEQLALGAVDVARQLIEYPYGDGLEVALGGGRRSFLPGSMADPEDEGHTGERLDERDLTREWVDRYANAAFVWNAEQFAAIDPARTDHLLGLFERSHMEYEHDRPTDAGGEPSLAEMTGKAIRILSRNPNGFYLLVEAGRVDHAHHGVNAYRTLTDGLAFADAVATAAGMTSEQDTLIVVTADHGHVLTIAGYPARGNPILGLSRNAAGELNLALDGKPYTTLGYANGATGLIDAPRADLTEVDTTDPDFVQQALVPLSSETHSGEDIAVYARGPWAHLFQNTIEQSFIFHVMDYAADIRGRAAAGVSNRRPARRRDIGI